MELPKGLAQRGGGDERKEVRVLNLSGVKYVTLLTKY